MLLGRCWVGRAPASRAAKDPRSTGGGRRVRLWNVPAGISSAGFPPPGGFCPENLGAVSGRGGAGWGERGGASVACNRRKFAMPRVFASVRSSRGGPARRGAFPWVCPPIGLLYVPPWARGGMRSLAMHCPWGTHEAPDAWSPGGVGPANRAGIPEVHMGRGSGAQVAPGGHFRSGHRAPEAWIAPPSSRAASRSKEN